MRLAAAKDFPTADFPTAVSPRSSYTDTTQIRPDIQVSDKELTSLWRRFGVARLEVFGSSVRGDFRSDSDVDLLVEFQPGERVGFLRLAELQLELQSLLGCDVDLVPRGGLKPNIRDRVLGDARALYAA